MSSSEGIKLPAERFRERFGLRNRYHINLLAEFTSTFLLLTLVTGVTIQYVLPGGKLNSYMNVTIGVGFSIAMSVYSAYSTSGAHMNPAVSLAAVTCGTLSPIHFLGYTAVQLVASYLGAALSYFVYRDQILNYTNGTLAIVGTRGIGSIFSAFPEAHVSNSSCFIDQLVGTALLLFFLSVVTDKNNRIPTFLHPLLFGFILITIGNSYGLNTGYQINPTRDLGPRILMYTMGYGSTVFSYHNYASWVFVVAPLIGGPIGQWAYIVLVGSHIPDSKVANTKLPLQNEPPEELSPLHQT